MAEDPTLVTTLVNMIMSGCQMNSGVFTLMGKGTPQFEAGVTDLTIVLNDGTYVIGVSYQGPPITFAAKEETGILPDV
jgi:hypothetical protein